MKKVNELTTKEFNYYTKKIAALLYLKKLENKQTVILFIHYQNNEVDLYLGNTNINENIRVIRDKFINKIISNIKHIQKIK